MNWNDTPQNRIAALVMEYAARKGLTYEQAMDVFREALNCG